MRRAGALGSLGRVAVLAVAALALTACGNQQPGMAAVVGSQAITEQQVDALAHALCSANNQGAGVRSLPSRGVRQGALGVLIQSELSRQLGAARRVLPDERQVALALKQDEANLNKLPSNDKTAFRAALKEYAEGQLILIRVGRKSLLAQGKTNPTQSQDLAEGSRIRGRFEKSHPVTVDPRFGTYAKGTLSGTSGSVSVAESARARHGVKADPSSTWAAALPISQTCG